MLIKKKVIIIAVSIISTLVLSGLIIFVVSQMNRNTSSLGDSFKKAGILDSKTKNQIVATINGKAITQADVNYLSWQNDHSPESANLSQSPKQSQTELIKQIAMSKLMIEEAQKNGFSLSDSEIQSIRDGISKSFSSSDKETIDFLKTAGVSKDEVIDILLQNQITSQMEGKLLSNVFLPSVVQGTFQTQDNDLRKAVDEYLQANKSDSDGNVKRETAQNLIQAYKESLLKNASLKILRS
jgi:hypothetical protein